MAIAFEDLRSLHDSGALYVALSHQSFKDGVEERLGGPFDYSADLETDSYVVTGRATGATIQTTAELIASIAPGPQSLLWGRAMSLGRAGAQQILERGRADGLTSLLTDEVPYPVGVDPDQTARDVAFEIAAVVAAVTVGGLAMVVPSGAGLAVLLVGELDFTQPRIDPRFLAHTPVELGSGKILDHRGAIHHLALMSGWGIDWTADWRRVELADPVTGSSATAEFDEFNRLSALQGALRS